MARYRQRPGFVLLTRFPDAPPLPVPPNQEVVQQDVITHLRSQAMIDACRTQGKEENLKWVWECAETGRVPTLGAVNPEEKEDRAKWGITERVGSAAFSYPIEVVRTTCTWPPRRLSSRSREPLGAGHGRRRCRRC